MSAALRADKAAALSLVPVSRETERRLDLYVDLLLAWQPKINLIAPSTVGSVWTRHIADSLQLMALAPEAARWVDLGSGAGFPGLALACALAERPGAHVTLVERNGKKAAFLREAVRVTGAPATVAAQDIGDYVDSAPAPPDCVTARALAPLQELLDWAEPFLRRGTVGLFLKGQHLGTELTDATRCWNIDYDVVPSLTGDGQLLRVRRLSSRVS